MALLRFDIMTLFPDLVSGICAESIIGRAQKAGILEVVTHNIRDYSKDKFHRVDDTPYGGGKGMLMQVEPIYRCWQSVCEEIGTKPYTIYLSPKGRVFNQQIAIELKEQHENIFLLCGHYEGVDQRVLDEIVDEDISIGDYVLTGGELGALVIADAVGRLCDGVLSEEVCFTDESHFNGLLEYPQYTRPPVWHDREVPAVLMSGHHANIVKWRREESLRVTKERRPDMLEKVFLDKKDKAFLKSIEKNEE